MIVEYFFTIVLNCGSIFFNFGFRVEFRVDKTILSGLGRVSGWCQIEFSGWGIDAQDSIPDYRAVIVSNEIVDYSYRSNIFCENYLTNWRWK